MTNTFNYFYKDFSAIGKFQSEKTITYSITEEIIEGNAIYGIKVSESGKVAADVIIRLPFANHSLAMDILTFLYENSVSVSNCQGVVDDLLFLSDSYNS